jgi:CarD family transcriptional regulator
MTQVKFYDTVDDSLLDRVFAEIAPRVDGDTVVTFTGSNPKGLSMDAVKVFLRRLLSREEAETLLERIPSIEIITEENAKLLRAKYLEAMRTYQPSEWVRIIKTVYFRANDPGRQRQRLSETERNIAESAKRYLCTELSLSLGRPTADLEAYLLENVKKMA